MSSTSTINIQSLFVPSTSPFNLFVQVCGLVGQGIIRNIHAPFHIDKKGGCRQFEYVSGEASRSHVSVVISCL